ncbi:MAG TPA: hypothetical protein VHT75_04345 [Acidimicrobiales bacterium]|jgi:hypothetical protein|nr:hypothetical protein [Acidimicrobiales bacterium]
MADWLDAAKHAADEALNARPGSPDEGRLWQISSNHALIAIAEALRALVGVLASMPVDDEPDRPAPCIGNDPMCPCQDGDACHYVDYPGSPSIPIPDKAGDR